MGGFGGGMAVGMGGMDGMGGFGAVSGAGGMPEMGAGQPGLVNVPIAGTQYQQRVPIPGLAPPTGPVLPAGVPVPPSGVGGAPGVVGQAFDGGFDDFITAFKSEMARAQDLDQRKAKFVSVDKTRLTASNKASRAIELRAEQVFGGGTVTEVTEGAGEESDPEALYDEWPDEMMLLGLGAEEAMMTLGSTTESTTESTKSDETDETESDGVWPIEMMVGF
jgi:hypothetical protein